MEAPQEYLARRRAAADDRRVEQIAEQIEADRQQLLTEDWLIDHDPNAGIVAADGWSDIDKGEGRQ